jgi:Ca2+-binding RTX toxin-like protein
MNKRLAAITGFVLLIAWPALTPAAFAATPKCNGQKATIKGGPQDDTLRGTKKADVIVGLGGNDIILGGGGNDIICGGSGGDSIVGQLGKDTLFGNGANDLLNGGDGDDRLVGSGGADVVDYFAAPAAVTVDLVQGKATGEGSDVLVGIESAGGSSFDDTIIGDDLPNTVDGQDGNDTIRTGGGGDLIAPGPGDDSVDAGEGLDALFFMFSETAVQVDLGKGTATGEGTDDFVGIESTTDSVFADTLVGSDGENLFITAGGDDHIVGGGDFDFLCYWFADQPLDVNLSTGRATGAGNDTFSEIEGVWGSLVASNKLVGNSAGNVLLGGAGNDTLLAGGGDDIMAGLGGDDVYDGGTGTFDDAALFGGPGGITVDLNSGTATGSGNDSLDGVESVEGTDFADTMIGDNLNNFIYGLGGDDHIEGGRGNDFIGGGDGTDQADGGDGSDQCWQSESVNACEGNGAAPTHPLADPIEEVTAFQRSF